MASDTARSRMRMVSTESTAGYRVLSGLAWGAQRSNCRSYQHRERSTLRCHKQTRFESASPGARATLLTWVQESSSLAARMPLARNRHLATGAYLHRLARALGAVSCLPILSTSQHPLH